MLDWFLYQVPWWVWAAPLVGVSVAALVAVTRLFGLRAAVSAAVAALAAGGGFLSILRARQQGYEDRKRKDAENAKAMVDRINEARARSADRRRRAPDRLYEDDGFKRP